MNHHDIDIRYKISKNNILPNINSYNILPVQ